MEKIFVVLCIHRRGKELQSAVVLLSSDLATSVDTAKKIEELGYEMNHPQALYVAVVEMTPDRVYTPNDFNSSMRTENFPTVYARLYDDEVVTNCWFNNEYRKKYELQKEIFESKYGEIKVGTHVSFSVENQSDWMGARDGVLIIDKDEFKIKTDISGTLTIDKGYDVYGTTIKPVQIPEHV